MTRLLFRHRTYSYLDRGFCSELIRRLRRFLSVEPMAFAPQAPANRDDGSASLSEQDRRLVRERFRSDIQETETLLGWECPDGLA